MFRCSCGLAVAICFLGMFAWPANAASADKDASPVGQKVASFTLDDHRGKSYSLDDFKSAKVIVLVMTGTECPLAKLYAPRLARMSASFSDQGVQFIGLNANSQDSVTEIGAYIKQHNLPFPVLKDVGNRIADQLGAIRTPEVFVLDHDRVIRYWGRIDDQYGVGYIRPEPQHEDLRNAVQQLLAGKAVNVSETESVGCVIGRIRKPAPDAQVTYSEHIAPILANRCVECHRDGEIAPFSLTEYQEVAGWAETIAEVISDKRMPPWHADPQYGPFKNDRSMPEEEKELVFQWVRDGAPQGEPSTGTAKPTFTAGWNLPDEPDDTIFMRDTAVSVPAEGVVQYKYYRAKKKFTEDRWLSAVEVQPGNRAVVHHILVFLRTADGRTPSGGGVDGFLAAYVPGMRAEPYPQGMAKRIPAGAELVFQVHYTPIGTPQTDRSRIGLVYADADDVEYEIRTISAHQTNLRIPPNDSNHEVTANPRTIPDNALLLSLMPHMHLRGKSVEYKLEPKAGKRKTLLEVPRYDFNWQTAYRFAEPIEISPGSKMHCVAHFDNSNGNPNNPNPNRLVRWGDQTWDEMMIGYFDIAVPKGQASKMVDPRVQGFFDRMDKNNDGVLEKNELSGRAQAMFDRADVDGDGKITVEELGKTFRGRR